MAPKRKEPTEATTEPTRRSTRTTTTPTGDKPLQPLTKEAAKKKGATDPHQNKEDEEKAEDEEPKLKKAKVASATAIGEIVADITLKNENGEDVSLASIYEKSGVVIFTYPKANTPGCTTQACGFRDLYDEIQAAGYQVYGLSADPPKSQLSWKTKHGFKYSLLSDPTKTLLKALGATEAQKRCHFIIEKGGKLLEAKIGVKPADDPKQSLAFIKAL